MFKELSVIYNTKISDKEFNILSDYIYGNFGIKMPPVKRIMLQSRLHKRLRFLNMSDFGEYIDYLFSPEGKKTEITEMMNVVSTNKTDFFREAAHFEFIENHILPKYASERPTRQIKIWSAGCSSGEEVYTICMTLEEYMRLKNDFNYHVFGTDISTEMLRKANAAIYSNDRTVGISHEHKKRYFLISKDRSANLVKVNAKIRKKASFSRLNFMEKHYDVESGFDIIFCRNVLIYFDRDTQEKVINRLCQKLDTGGYLFLGH
ncbi:MAG: methyltransferase domain-containing protein, partial [Cyclobacteriaceae bacterium]|nr:methyltransferase domain-containing protein [Cyclobacteriaceae bacterium]